MTMRLALIFAATALESSSAFAQEPAAAAKDATASQSPSPEIKAGVESCSAHKFETTVDVITDGKKRSSKVKLCGKEGQSDADWATTLKDAAKKVEGNEKMPQTVKDQIIAALNAEIAKIEAAMAFAAKSALPPVAKPPAERPPEYSILPPLPTAPAAKTKLSQAKPGPPREKPRLTFQCYTPGELGAGGPCISLERETLLTVRADENLAGGARLRFLRRGDDRGEVELAEMRKGQSRRFKLPSQLCAGVVGSQVEIQILGSSTSPVLDTLGPYPLRC